MTNVQTPRLRSACDACHEAKVRCTGGTPCIYCKNHHENCHYSFTARIGKPKGSRNRKTIARMREAALREALSQQSCLTPPVSSHGSSPSSVSAHPVSTMPEWVDNVDYSLPTTQYASYPSHAWLSPPPQIHTPPDSIDMSLKQMQAHEDTFSSQERHRQASQTSLSSLSRPFESHLHTPPHLSSPSPPAGTLNNTDYFLPIHDLNNYPDICDCFHWHTSNLSSLHAMKSLIGIMQQGTFDESLQLINSTLAACQRTVVCRLCERKSSMMFILMTSLHMVFNHLETLLSIEKQQQPPTTPPTVSSISNPVLGTQDIHYEEQRAIRMMQLNHMLLMTQNTLKNIREITLVTHRGSFSVDPAAASLYHDVDLVGIVPGSSLGGGSDYIHQALDKLQTGIGSLLSSVSVR